MIPGNPLQRSPQISSACLNRRHRLCSDDGKRCHQPAGHHHHYLRLSRPQPPCPHNRNERRLVVRGSDGDFVPSYNGQSPERFASRFLEAFLTQVIPRPPKSSIALHCCCFTRAYLPVWHNSAFVWLPVCPAAARQRASEELLTRGGFPISSGGGKDSAEANGGRCAAPFRAAAGRRARRGAGCGAVRGKLGGICPVLPQQQTNQACFEFSCYHCIKIVETPPPIPLHPPKGIRSRVRKKDLLSNA